MTHRILRPLLAALFTLAAVAARAQACRWGHVAMGGGGFVNAIVPSQTQARHSGLCLAVDGGGRADGVRIIQAGCSTGTHQQWAPR